MSRQILRISFSLYVSFSSDNAYCVRENRVLFIKQKYENVLI